MCQADFHAILQSGAKGGKVLSLLHERTTSYIGDPTGQELCFYLTQKACIPYMEILEKWVYKGIICDPYEEVRYFASHSICCCT
jgi:gamma-tubulin complex component 2